MQKVHDVSSDSLVMELNYLTVVEVVRVVPLFLWDYLSIASMMEEELIVTFIIRFLKLVNLLADIYAQDLQGQCLGHFAQPNVWEIKMQVITKQRYLAPFYYGYFDFAFNLLNILL